MTHGDKHRNCHKSRPLKKKNVKKTAPYDYIIIGGGTAGSALSYKLNQLKPNLKLLVLESGQDDQAMADTVPGLMQPGSVQELYPGTGEVWSRFINGGIVTVGRAVSDALHVWNTTFQTKNDAMTVAELPEFTYNLGSTWGGSSAHNYTVWLRPTTWYFDYLNSLGLSEMTWAESVNIFKEIENRSAIGPPSTGATTPNAPYFSVTNLNPYQPPIIADNGFNPALHGLNGNVVLYQQNYIDPNYQTYLAAFQQMNTDAGYDRFGIAVNTEQTQYPELFSRQNSTGIYNRVALSDQPSIYNFIGGTNRISLLPTAPSNYTTPNIITRVHAGVAYLLPVSQKPNVTVLSNVFATKILMDKCNRVTGVEYINGRNVYRNGRNNQTDYAASNLNSVASRDAACVNSVEALRNPVKVYCNYEVVISAGFVHTPMLMELSGIGNPEILGKYGIKTHVQLNGVGENLSDHAVCRVSYTGAVKSLTPYNTNGLLPSAGNLGNYRVRTGVSCEPAPDALAVLLLGLSQRVYPIWCDAVDNIARYWIPNPFLGKDGYTPMDPSLPIPPGFTQNLQLCYPESRGSTHITSSNPTDVPLTKLNAYESMKDVDRLVAAFRFANEVAERARGTSYKEANAVPPFANTPITLPSEQFFQDYHYPKYADFTDDFFQYTGSLVSNPSPKEYNLGTFVKGHACLVEQIKGMYLEMTSGAAAGEKRLILHWDRATTTVTVAAPFNGEIAPGDTYGVRRTHPGKIVAAMKSKIWTTWHGSGTAKMGLDFDPLAVVDQRHRVFGVKGLRVADNSIFPVVPDVNTQTTAYYAGWRAAIKISEDIDNMH